MLQIHERLVEGNRAGTNKLATEEVCPHRCRQPTKRGGQHKASSVQINVLGHTLDAAPQNRHFPATCRG